MLGVAQAIPPVEDMFLAKLSQSLPKFVGHSYHHVSSSKLKLETVVSQFDAGRQLTVGGFMLQLMRDVCQVGAARFDSGNDSEWLVHTQVAGMRLVTHCVND